MPILTLQRRLVIGGRYNPSGGAKAAIANLLIRQSEALRYFRVMSQPYKFEHSNFEFVSVFPLICLFFEMCD